MIWIILYILSFFVSKYMIKYAFDNDFTWVDWFMFTLLALVPGLNLLYGLIAISVLKKDNIGKPPKWL